MRNTRDPLLFLVGATASGKKRVALSLSSRLPVGLLSLDSMKVYRGMDLGTDKAKANAFGLTDLVDPDQPFSVGDYVRDAAVAVARLRDEGKAPLFVGGTGLYLRALVRGLFEAPEIPAAVRAEVRRELGERGSAAGHARLAQVDAVSAARIHPNDLKRVARALEVYDASGRTLSQWQKDGTAEPIGGSPMLVGLRWQADALHRRIDLRVAEMFRGGLVDEVRALRDRRAIGPVAGEAIGYRETLGFLDSRIDLEECQRQIVRSTRQLARRQATWFRQFPEIAWVEADGLDDDRLLLEVERLFSGAWVH